MQTAMPGLTWCEGHLKAEPSISVYCRCRGLHRTNRHRAAEVAVAVRRAQTLLRFRPVGRYPAAAHNTARLYFKDVGKIAAQRDLELEPHRLQAIVGDIEVFVHA